MQEHEITRWDMFVPTCRALHECGLYAECIPCGHKEITITCNFKNLTQTDVEEKIFSANCNTFAREATLRFEYDDIPPELVSVKDVYLDEEDNINIYFILCAPIKNKFTSRGEE